MTITCCFLGNDVCEIKKHLKSPALKVVSIDRLSLRKAKPEWMKGARKDGQAGLKKKKHIIAKVIKSLKTPLNRLNSFEKKERRYTNPKKQIS